MAVTKEKYNETKIEKLHDYLKAYKDRDRAIDYEILVDGFRAVRRTNDPDMFSMFEDFVTHNTESVTIIFFSGTSNNNDKHIFSFRDSAKSEKENDSFNGIEDVETLVEARVIEKTQEKEKNRRIYDLQNAKRELEDEVDELKRSLAKLEKQNQEIIGRQSPLAPVLGEIGAAIATSFLKNNLSAIRGLPGGEALAGILSGDDDKTKHLSLNNKDEEVTFKPKDTTSMNAENHSNWNGVNNPNRTQPASSLSDEDKMAIDFVGAMKSRFSKDDFDQITVILDELAANKSKIPAVLKDISLQDQPERKA